ncbi:hypothetical protein Dip510_001900 [Elusimicrobium posterum]|uniref:hypothetical protein n=1 Tax=Elusimicrobium posterum TaxID=3116653 RepID=UPI003C73DF35
MKKIGIVAYNFMETVFDISAYLPKETQKRMYWAESGWNVVSWLSEGKQSRPKPRFVTFGPFVSAEKAKEYVRLKGFRGKFKIKQIDFKREEDIFDIPQTVWQLITSKPLV